MMQGMRTQQREYPLLCHGVLVSKAHRQWQAYQYTLDL